MIEQEGDVWSPSEAEYAEVLQAVERAQAVIEDLEAHPRSEKRDAALHLLRERHAAAINRLREIKSDNHGN